MNPAELVEYEAQRRALAKLRAEARRWLLRALLLLVIAVVSFTRRGSLFITIGVALAVLALPAYAMSREATRIGDEAQRKINLLEAGRAAGQTGGRTG